MSEEFPTKKEIRAETLDEINNIVDSLNSKQVHDIFLRVKTEDLITFSIALSKAFKDAKKEDF